LARIWTGDIGRKGTKTLAPSTLNILPKLLEAPMRTYLMMLEKTASFEHPLVQHEQRLLEQDHVGGLFGDVHGGVHADADVGGVERGRVVDAVPHEADGVLARLQSLE
jgi:hypothetical protein